MTETDTYKQKGRSKKKLAISGVGMVGVAALAIGGTNAAWNDAETAEVQGSTGEFDLEINTAALDDPDFDTSWETGTTVGDGAELNLQAVLESMDQEAWVPNETREADFWLRLSEGSTHDGFVHCENVSHASTNVAGTTLDNAFDFTLAADEQDFTAAGSVGTQGVRGVAGGGIEVPADSTPVPMTIEFETDEVLPQFADGSGAWTFNAELATEQVADECYYEAGVKTPELPRFSELDGDDSWVRAYDEVETPSNSLIDNEYIENREQKQFESFSLSDVEVFIPEDRAYYETPMERVLGVIERDTGEDAEAFIQRLTHEILNMYADENTNEHANGRDTSYSDVKAYLSGSKLADIGKTDNGTGITIAGRYNPLYINMLDALILYNVYMNMGSFPVETAGIDFVLDGIDIQDYMMYGVGGFHLDILGTHDRAFAMHSLEVGGLEHLREHSTEDAFGGMVGFEVNTNSQNYSHSNLGHVIVDGGSDGYSVDDFFTQPSGQHSAESMHKLFSVADPLPLEETSTHPLPQHVLDELQWGTEIRGAMIDNPAELPAYEWHIVPAFVDSFDELPSDNLLKGDTYGVLTADGVDNDIYVYDGDNWIQDLDHPSQR